MTRLMLDALYPLQIPADTRTGTIIAAYVGHADNPKSFTQAMARFPEHVVVSIASKNAVDAQVLDVERGAVDPGDYTTQRTWVDRQIARGIRPLLYCNTSTWPTLKRDIRADVDWWAANWSMGPTIPAGAVGIQYSGVAGYDVSMMLDYIPAIDGTRVAPLPPIQQPKGLTVTPTVYRNATADDPGYTAAFADLGGGVVKELSTLEYQTAMGLGWPVSSVDAAAWARLRSTLGCVDKAPANPDPAPAPAT